MKTVFVYGTLMKGQRAHDKLGQAEFIGKGVLRDYRMFDLGAFPGIQPCKGESVIGELYSVEDDVISLIDEYEGKGNLYSRETVYVNVYKNDVFGPMRAYYERHIKAYTYIYNNEADSYESCKYEWGTSDNDYVWYGAYGSNIDEERFLCYIEGGTFSVNGKSYSGCDDKNRWIDETFVLYPGDVYSANHSPSWNGNGVAFYDEKGGFDALKGFCFMKLYKIRILQLKQIQKQEGLGPLWYGRTVIVGVHDNGVPVYTFTSKFRGEHTEPDSSYSCFVYEAIRKECNKINVNPNYARFFWDGFVKRPPFYNETPDSYETTHPYKLLCTRCLKEAKDCKCYDGESYKFRNFAEIDEEMYEAVVLFNKKGYGTSVCCQGTVRRKDNKITYSSYMGFSQPIPEELEIKGIDPKYVKYKRNRSDCSYKYVYIDFNLRIGKTNEKKQEEKAQQLKNEAIRAWLETAKSWPDISTKE